MSYIIKQYDKFIISNDYDTSVYVTILYKSNCESNIFDIVVPRYATPGETTEIVVLPKKEGVYKILYEDIFEGIKELIVYNYPSFLASTIEDVNHILCGCPCSDCDDCNKTEKEYLSAILKLLSYNIINNANYNLYLTLTNDCIKCNILDINQCILLNETILGNSDNTTLMKQIIAYYYLVFYYTDFYQNTSSDIVIQTYQYNNIIKCIKKLGIDEDCIKTKINNFINPPK